MWPKKQCKSRGEGYDGRKRRRVRDKYIIRVLSSGGGEGEASPPKVPASPPIDFVTAPQLTNTFSRPVYVTIPFFALHRIQIPTP